MSLSRQHFNTQLSGTLSVVKPTLTCIIPAYNEEPRLGAVLSVVADWRPDVEVIVVDDASTDQTFQVAKTYPVTVVRHRVNQGKAGAVYSGLQQAQADLVMLLDADLVGLTTANLETLLAPAVEKSVMTMAILGNTWFFFRFNQIDPWVGERVLSKKILQDLDWKKIQNSSYAIESHINQQILAAKLPVVTISWPNVKYLTKFNKQQKGYAGILADLKMYHEVYRTFGYAATFWQQIVMPYHQWLRRFGVWLRIK